MNNTSFNLNVDNVLTEDKKAEVAEFTGTVSVQDTVAPTVIGTMFAANGDLEITFSEPLKNVNPIVRVAGQPVVITNVVAGATKVVVPAANLSVAAGTTATVYVAGAKDTVGNEMNIFNGSVTKVADTTLPTIASVQQLGHNQVRVVFSEVLGSDASDELQTGELRFLKGAALNDIASTVLKNTTVDATGKTYDVTFDASEIYGSPEADSATVSLLLAKNAVEDVAGNGIAEYAQSFTFKADKTGPQFVSSKAASNKQALELTFSEEFVADTGSATNNIDESKIIVTGADGVRYNVLSAAAKGAGEDAKVLVVDFVADAGTITNGTYTVQLQAGALKDARNNLSAAATTVVAVGDVADTTKPEVTLDTEAGADQLVSAPNKFVVDFSKEVTTSAVNLANYKLDGAALPAGTVVYFNSTAKNSVTIELPVGSVNIGNATTGTNALLTVANVADTAGNTINSTNLTVQVGDNTTAMLQSAQKIGNTLVLTFNESLSEVTAADANIANVLANYDIKVAGTSVTTGTEETAAASAARVVGSPNKVQITFSNVTGTGYNPAQTVTVATKSTGDLTDANQYKVQAGTAVTAN